MPDIHTLDIGIFGPYAQISDGELGYFSKLPDIHSSESILLIRSTAWVRMAQYYNISDGYD